MKRQAAGPARFRQRLLLLPRLLPQLHLHVRQRRGVRRPSLHQLPHRHLARHLFSRWLLRLWQPLRSPQPLPALLLHPRR